MWQPAWPRPAGDRFLVTWFIYSHLCVTHSCLVEVRSGAYRLLDGQRPFRNAVLLQRVQVRGSTEALPQFSTTGGPGSHCPSLNIPRLDFCVSVRQSGCTASGRYLLRAAPRTAEPLGATTALVIMANVTSVVALTPGSSSSSLVCSFLYPQPRRHESLWIEAILYDVLHIYQIIN